MLFTPLTLRGVTLRNRICVSPMCQYSSEDGFATDWHLVHLGSRAVGGAAVVFTEATAVTAQGRISARDLGIWKDEHVPGLERVARFIAAQGALPGLQLAHAGRKASVTSPWEGNHPVLETDGGWRVVGPSDIPFAQGYAAPEELTVNGIREVVAAFADAARRALSAGFQVVEIHAAHGYLLHEFLSPLSNRRTDRYGGSLENRSRLALDVTAGVRAVWPERLPLFVRLSSTDWIEGGWDIEQSVELARALKSQGADLVDCSSGGNVKDVEIPFGPGYQTAFAERIRRDAGIATGAVGLITSAQQADHVLRTRQADMIIMARQLLRDPYWPLRAASELKAQAPWPNQYLRARI
ncbi:MAG TPA: NADH:flavin oxidoreductase/NADH oxidase [Spirochaetia bacterium]|nr:NADH:flavin oxidoreductase/NADH oxidase [Spirochaetia bacterium]